MNHGKLLAVCGVWLVVLGVAAVAWRLFVTPARTEASRQREAAAEQQREALQRQTLARTSGEAPYRHELTLALDSFSGYAVLRSPQFERQLRQQGIRLILEDDGADYPARLERLRDGRVQLAAFTIDALVKASAEMGDLPATIVAVIDETRGADALVARRDVFPSLDALNAPDTRFVLTPDSPSEMLARLLVRDFQLDRLPADPFLPANDAADVVEHYRRAAPDAPHAYVLWEPFVAQLLDDPQAHVLVDSSRFTGYIIDVLVANREFLVANEQVVDQVVECYFGALFHYRDQMAQLVQEDARRLGGRLANSQAESLVAGIHWKNTLENYAHFGMHPDGSLPHMVDLIERVTRVLLDTRAISSDPAGGRPHLLYYDRTLRRLQERNFHPGAETIRAEAALAELSDDQWEQLTPVAVLPVPPLVFPRGTAQLTDHSRRILDELVEMLNAWPQYYVVVHGNADRRGDLAANERLALERAGTAERYLVERGIAGARIRTVGVTPSGETSVTFLLGQTPY